MSNDLINVFFIGNGGREHALAWKIKQSPRCGKIFFAMGNGGTITLGENIEIMVDDIKGLVEFAKKNNIGLTVVGPEVPLALGIVDAFKSHGLTIFGPTKAATRIESSKAFAKRLMSEHDIPTADFKVFRSHKQALAYALKRLQAAKSCVPATNNIVIKASGLAAGKGAYICPTEEEVQKAIKEIMIDRVHKSAGDEVIIEDFIPGDELSVHALCDGKNFQIFPHSQDYKKIGEGDNGVNTGGMGAICSSYWVEGGLAREVVVKTLAAMSGKGRVFTGLLYPGIKVISGGKIMVLEFNARFGDPETQVYMRLLKNDLLDELLACVEGRLDQIEVAWFKGYAVCVVLASQGYPGKYKTGLPISGIAEYAEKIPGVVVFHAGTFLSENGTLYTAGGRVLNVTAIGETVDEALRRVYAAARLIEFEGKYYRRDIAKEYL